jgi:hypothetical protein
MIEKWAINYRVKKAPTHPTKDVAKANGRNDFNPELLQIGRVSVKT